MISCEFIQTIMSVGLCFYSKSFQEGEKKDEWKSDNGFVGNKTETFPQLHHLPPWLYLYPTTSSLSPLSYSIFISIPQLHFCHPYKSIIYPLALSLSNNFIIVIRLSFPQLHHLPTWFFLSHNIIIRILFSKNPSSTPMFHIIWMLLTIIIYNNGPHYILLKSLFSPKHVFY